MSEHERASSMSEVVEWYISDELAGKYRAMYGPYMAKWRLLKRNNKFKPVGIPLEAWILLAGAFKNHCAVVGLKPKKKAIYTAPTPPPEPMSNMRVPYRPHNTAPQVAPVKYTQKTVTDISDECLHALINAGYGRAQARDLVSRCKDLKSVMYDNRPQETRRLTLPDKPTKRCTSFFKWVNAVLQKHPPSTSTGCL